jgi:hypothetical protein
MTMHLLPVYFNDLKVRKAKRRPATALSKLELSKVKHQLFVEKMTGGKKADKKVLEKEWRREYRETMQPDMSDYHSRGIGKGIAAKPDAKVYTGRNLLGIATLHKSNMVPVFSAQDAEDISRMRRG